MVNVDSVTGGYNAYTKAGNPYKKTKASKKAFTIAGLGVGTYLTLKDAKALAPEGGKILKTLKDMVKTFPTNLKMLKSIGVWGLVGLGVGAITDLIVNKARKHKADRIAACNE